MKTGTNVNELTRMKRLDEASEWLLRLQSADRTEQQLNDWLRWIDADPENFAEFERLQRDWKDLDALKTDAHKLFPDEGRVGRGSHSLSPAAGRELERGGFDDLVLTPAQKKALLEQETAHAIQSGRRRLFHLSPFRGERPREGAFRDVTRARAVLALAAGVGAIVLAAAVLRDQGIWSSTSTQQVAAAATHRAATLPDGSKMILGAQSRVDVDFNGPKRQLDLSNGEAYFKVKHDKARPFVVQAGEVSVTAIGTAFDVRREHDKITVTVEEGTVEVSAPPDSSPAGGRPGGGPVTWRAEAGYQLTYSTRQRTASIASVNPSAELAWRNGELAYVREPLGSVVENLNRYSERKIRFEDPAIAHLTFTGTAFASSLDDWVAGIEQAYPISAERTASGDIVLSSGK